MVWEQCIGKDESLLDTDTLEVPVHRAIVRDFVALRQAAAAEGMDLRIASGFRSFGRQLQIWNDKACGRRPLLDDAGRTIPRDSLSDRDCVLAILRWSALPGASRHHWGTDLDVYDAAAVPGDYRLQLVAQEYGPQGPFARLSAFLDESLSPPDAPFFRPFNHDRGGVGAEPWHISHRAQAATVQRQMSPVRLREELAACDAMALREAVLEQWDAIVARYVEPHFQRESTL